MKIILPSLVLILALIPFSCQNIVGQNNFNSTQNYLPLNNSNSKQEKIFREELSNSNLINNIDNHATGENTQKIPETSPGFGVYLLLACLLVSSFKIRYRN